jgi:RNA polymerase sigma factor (sigma-70 family)
MANELLLYLRVNFRRKESVEVDANSTELIELWRQGDKAAATELYRRYLDRLLNVIRPRLSERFQGVLDAEDVCASAFRTILRRVQNGEFQFVDDENVWKLLVTIGLNKLRNKTRLPKRGVLPAEGKIEGVSLDVFDSATAKYLTDDMDPEMSSIFEDLLEQLLKGLRADNQKVLEMRLEGYKYSDIARQFGYSEKWVQRRMNEIREAMKTLDAEEN